MSHCQWGYWSLARTLCSSTPLSSSGIPPRTLRLSSRYRGSAAKRLEGGRCRCCRCCCVSGPVSLSNSFVSVVPGQLHQHGVHPQETRRGEGGSLSYPGGHVHHQPAGGVHGARPFVQLPDQSLQGLTLGPPQPHVFSSPLGNVHQWEIRTLCQVLYLTSNVFIWNVPSRKEPIAS